MVTVESDRGWGRERGLGRQRELNAVLTRIYRMYVNEITIYLPKWKPKEEVESKSAKNTKKKESRWLRRTVTNRVL